MAEFILKRKILRNLKKGTRKKGKGGGGGGRTKYFSTPQFSAQLEILKHLNSLNFVQKLSSQNKTSAEVIDRLSQTI